MTELQKQKAILSLASSFIAEGDKIFTSTALASALEVWQDSYPDGRALDAAYREFCASGANHGSSSMFIWDFRATSNARYFGKQAQLARSLALLFFAEMLENPV